VPFPLKYVRACIQFENKQVKEALSCLYALLRDAENALVQTSAPSESRKASDNLTRMNDLIAKES
jgi:hypothetical protein